MRLELKAVTLNKNVKEINSKTYWNVAIPRDKFYELWLDGDFVYIHHTKDVSKGMKMVHVSNVWIEPKGLPVKKKAAKKK